MTSKALVGPLPTVRFLGGIDDPSLSFEEQWARRPKVAYTPPRNTCDPRAAACTDHHVACDCREAEFAENAQEYAAARRETQQAFDEILAGHPTYVRDGTPCQCTGCKVARAAHIYPRGNTQ